MIRFVLGIEPRETPLPLVHGGSFHAGRAAWYRTKGNARKAASACAEYYEDPRIQLPEESLKGTLIRRAQDLLNVWIVKVGQADFAKFDILEVERYFEVAVPGLKGFVFTGRIDDIRRDRESKLIYIYDAKTSGYSETLTMDSFLYGDQATGYLWGAQEALGYKIAGIRPDIAYWPRGSQDPAKIRCSRPITVTRSPDDVRQFQLGIMQLYAEIAQKYAALKGGADPRALFSRNTHYCVAYGHVCEFADICRSKSLAQRNVSKAFFNVRKGNLDIKKISVFTEDRMAGG